jgi:O-antigen ligase
VQYRVHDYPIAAAKIAENLWLGSGVGTHYAPKHIILDNQYLLTFVEAGLVGLIVLIGLFLTAAVTAVRDRFRAADPDTRDLLLSLTASLFVPIVGAVTFDLLSFQTVSGLLFVLLGAIGCMHRLVQGTPHSSEFAIAGRQQPVAPPAAATSA